jgi:acyl-CoA thioester hydrolase
MAYLADALLSHIGAGAIAAMRRLRVVCRGRPGLPWRRIADREQGMSRVAGGIVTYRGAVYASHCDHIGHMNIASYGAKFDEATWVLFCELGLTPSYLRGESHGMAAVQQNITYQKELFAGDVIEIRSRLVEVAVRRLRFRHEMRNIETGELAAISEINGVHLDKKAHKSCDLPAPVRAAAEAMLAAARPR